MSLLTSVASNTFKSIGSNASKVNIVGNSSASMLNSYSTLRSTLSGITGGAVSLPKASQTSLGGFLTRLNGIGESAKTILNILGLSGVAGNSAHLQASNNDYERGSFRWLEMETTPDSFATADSVLIFASDPICNMANELVPIGMCQNLQFSTSLGVVPFKELRCEETMVYPTKSQPGNLTLTRLCGNYSSLASRLHITAGWNFGSHTDTYKPLFGLLVIFATPSRDRTIASLYFERCAITSASMSITANDFQVADTVNIVFGRCITVGDGIVDTAWDDVRQDAKANAGKTATTEVTDSKGNTERANITNGSSEAEKIADKKELQKQINAKGDITVKTSSSEPNDRG